MRTLGRLFRPILELDDWLNSAPPFLPDGDPLATATKFRLLVIMAAWGGGSLALAWAVGKVNAVAGDWIALVGMASFFAFLVFSMIRNFSTIFETSLEELVRLRAERDKTASPD